MALDLDTAAVTKSPFFIGLLGAMVALRGVPGASWKSRAFNALSGSLISGFTSPAIAEFFGLNTPTMESAAAFVVGLLGLNITAAVVGWISEMRLSDVLPFLRKGG